MLKHIFSKKVAALLTAAAVVFSASLPAMVYAGNNSGSGAAENSAVGSTDANGTTTSDIGVSEDMPAGNGNTEEVVSEPNQQAHRLGAGNYNIDIDIVPETDSVLSGNTAVYTLTFKASGATANFHGSKIVIVLPERAALSQPEEELRIAGVTPYYDAAAGTLSYVFPVLATGQTYTLKIKVIPPNGITPNGEILTAKAYFSAAGFNEISDEASINVEASANVSVTKKYAGTADKQSGLAPAQGDTGVWNIGVSMPKKSAGQLYIEEESHIIVKDTIPAGLVYVCDDAGGVYDQDAKTVTWTFDAPSYSDQEAASGNLFAGSVNLCLKFDETLADFSKVTNTVKATVTAVGAYQTSSNASASVQIASPNSNYAASDGSWFAPVHAVQGGTGTPAVSDWQTLDFSTQYTIGQDFMTDSGKKPLDKVLEIGYRSITLEYLIDSNLTLTTLSSRLPYYMPIVGTPALPLQSMPEAYIAAKTADGWLPAVQLDYTQTNTSTSSYQYVTVKLSELGVLPGQHVEAVSITYKNMSGGFAAILALQMKFSISKGFAGTVTNSVKEYGTFRDGTDFTVLIADGSPMSPRSAKVVSSSGNTAVVKNEIRFTEANGNIVSVGKNKVQGVFTNDSSSKKVIAGPFEDAVILPPGVTADVSSAELRDVNGVWRPANGAIVIVTDNFGDSGRQLIKIVWPETELAPNQNLGFRFDVNISQSAPNRQTIESYAFTGEKDLKAANASSIEGDENDLNGNGDFAELSVKSSSLYAFGGVQGVLTEKSVKGELDNDYGSLGHTVLNGGISYKLSIVNLYSDKIYNMTLLDVLPSVGDMGITDGASRGSAFTPEMTGPVLLPKQWEAKVVVMYSTAFNPSRADLDKNTVYPSTTLRLADSAGTEEPAWMTEAEVVNWKDIHSFKIELAPGVEFVAGESITLYFNMKAPAELDEALTDPKANELGRAAWNSFAFAANTSQAVEPAMVGVVVNVPAQEQPGTETPPNDGGNERVDPPDDGGNGSVTPPDNGGTDKGEPPAEVTPDSPKVPEITTDDPDTPAAEITDEPALPRETDINDGDTPSGIINIDKADETKANPKTADESAAGMWVLTMFTATTAFAVVTRIRRKSM